MVRVTPERKRIRWTAALVLVGLAGVGVAVVAYVTSPLGDTPTTNGAAPAAKIRVPMFVDPSLVRATPRFRFTFDPPEALAALRGEERLDEQVDGSRSDLDRCIRLMAWTRRQWEPGVPSPYPPLDARIILRDIRRGFTGGFCAQYNYVLAQSLQSFGIPARYVSVVEHEVVEARLADEGRWICLDPLYDTYYTDHSGRALSVHEIHARLLQGRPIEVSSSGRITDLRQHLEAFRSFAVWLKNDHISSPINFTDLERYKVYFLDGLTPEPMTPPGALTTDQPIDLYPG